MIQNKPLTTPKPLRNHAVLCRNSMTKHLLKKVDNFSKHWIRHEVTILQTSSEHKTPHNMWKISIADSNYPQTVNFYSK